LFTARFCLLALASGFHALAQNPVASSTEFEAAASSTEFEAASVKRHVPSVASFERAGIEEDKALVRIDNLSLRTLIGLAYRVKAFQIAGPSWLDGDTFDITAKPPAGYQHNQLPELLEKLLADRFKLEVHHEARTATGYALVVSKGGPKLKETTGPRTYFTVRPGLIEGNQRSIADLREGLSRMLDRPVEDRTALTGSYDLKLEWNPQELTAAGIDSGAGEAPSLFTAVQEQLGLKLERTTMPIDHVIVDRALRIPVTN
jgi:uncharacterized protein (TIGR03435 family)